MTEYLVIGFYADTMQRYADRFQAASVQEAEDQAAALGVSVVAVATAESALVDQADYVRDGEASA